LLAQIRFSNKRSDSTSFFDAAALDFPELESWNMPRIPRPKVEKSRRERLITAEETMKILTRLLAPRRNDEKACEARNRRRVGLVF
jgi:hypothetical protein